MQNAPIFIRESQRVVPQDRKSVRNSQRIVPSASLVDVRAQIVIGCTLLGATGGELFLMPRAFRNVAFDEPPAANLCRFGGSPV